MESSQTSKTCPQMSSTTSSPSSGQRSESQTEITTEETRFSTFERWSTSISKVTKNPRMSHTVKAADLSKTKPEKRQFRRFLSKKSGDFKGFSPRKLDLTAFSVVTPLFYTPKWNLLSWTESSLIVSHLVSQENHTVSPSISWLTSDSELQTSDWRSNSSSWRASAEQSRTSNRSVLAIFEECTTQASSARLILFLSSER